MADIINTDIFANERKTHYVIALLILLGFSVGTPRATPPLLRSISMDLLGTYGFWFWYRDWDDPTMTTTTRVGGLGIMYVELGLEACFV